MVSDVRTRHLEAAYTTLYEAQNALMDAEENYLRSVIAREEAVLGCREIGITERELMEALGVSRAAVTQIIRRGRDRRGIPAPQRKKATA